MTLRGFPFYGAGPRAPKEEGGCKGGDALGGDIRYTGEPSVEGGHFLLRGEGFVLQQKRCSGLKQIRDQGYVECSMMNQIVERNFCS